MNTAVIFSVTIFDESRAWMFDKWIDMLNEHFSDADVYIGVNPGTCDSVANKVTELKPKFKHIYRFVKPELYAESDASGYQRGLEVAKWIRDENRQQAHGFKNHYDRYWFIHTKGGVNIRFDRFEYYLNEFVAKRKEIDAFLDLNPHIGSYGHYGVGQSADGVTQWKTLNHLEFDHGNIPVVENKPFDKLTTTHINWSYVETFFVMNGKPVNWFLEKADDTYFNTKIKNRWYFEVVFPWLSSRFGLQPYVKYGISQFSPHDLNLLTREWEKENGLSFPPIINAS
jgi:hypothetical protein